MITTNCYSGYSWRVYRYNNLIGYVVASSQYNAYMVAKKKYGDFIWIERVLAP